ncbi:MAG: FAD-dependent oxidoreductase, partial [Chloroflexi bacterium]
KKWQIVYAIIIGVLFSSQLPWVSSPEVALLLGNLFAFAVGLHHAPRLHIQKVTQLSQTTYEVLAVPNRPLLFKPGQYLELSLPHKQQDIKGMRRVFSIASAPNEKFVRFGITATGKVSSFKKELLASEGKSIRATQLGGDFTLPSDTSKPLLFIAGGVGITPFRSMLSDMLETSQHRDITLFYGAATTNAVIYQDILDKAEQKVGLRVVPVIAEPEKNWKGESGFVRVSLLHRYVPDFRDRLIYISGPPVMVETIRKQLRQKGVDKRHIKTDYFTGY